MRVCTQSLRVARAGGHTMSKRRLIAGVRFLRTVICSRCHAIGARYHLLGSDWQMAPVCLCLILAPVANSLGAPHEAFQSPQQAIASALIGFATSLDVFTCVCQRT